ncbi:MAG TPA: hypothetical protein VIH21_10680, partial [Dehalococcoidia bacterium]
IGLPTGTPEEADASAWIVGNGAAIYPSGRRLFVVTHTSGNGELSQKIVTGIVGTFREKYLENVELNVERAQTVYTQQLGDQAKIVDQAEDAVTAYYATRPAGTSTENDPRALALSRDAERAQRDYAATQQQIASIALQKQATLEGEDVTLRVEDPASLPTTPNLTSKRSLLAMPIAGFLLALSLSAAVYAFLLRTDNSIRTADDLEAFSGLALLGTVPDVGGMKKRHWPRHFFRMAVAGLGVTAQR